MNDQQNFWANEYAQDYIEKNSQFNLELGIDAWQKMIQKIGRHKLYS